MCCDNRFLIVVDAQGIRFFCEDCGNEVYPQDGGCDEAFTIIIQK